MSGRWVPALLVLLVAGPPGLAAQAAGAALEGRIQEYTFQDPEAAGLEGFRLRALPFGATLALGPVTLDLNGAWAEGEATGPDGASATLSGLTDTDVALTLGLGRDRASLTLGATLPTGATELTLGEAAVAGVVAAELLPFAVTTWGTGGGAGADLAVAFQAGAWALGLSGGYRQARTFEPVEEGSLSFRPGSSVRAGLAAEGEVGEAGTLALLLGYQHHGEDAVGENDLFRPGARLDASLSWIAPVGIRGVGRLSAGVHHRENGTLLLETPGLEGAGDSPAQQLFVVGGDLGLPLGEGGAVFRPAVEARAFRSEDGVGQGWLTTGGVALELRGGGTPSAPAVVVTPAFRARWGRAVVREELESGIRGWEAGLTLRLGTP